MTNTREAYDVIVVGAGPAGLTAALVLGRCRRRVLLFDDGEPRNRYAQGAHGVFTREGTPPAELQRIAREQLAPYDVTLTQLRVANARRVTDGFEVRAGDTHFRARKLLLATGVRDRELSIPGLHPLLGKRVFQCPYCDGWEVRDQLLGALAPKAGAADFALALTTWSSSVTLFTDGRFALPGDERAQLVKAEIRVYDERITALDTHGDRLLVRLASETVVPIDALFAHAGFEQHAEFTKELGYELEPSGRARTDDHQRTNVPGLYVAGDAGANLHSVNVAAASGYVAATAINRELREEAHR